MTDLTAEKIHKEIVNYINRDVTIIDALVFYAQKYDIEIEVLGEMIKKSPILKSKVRDDAEKLSLVEETVKLPL
tara:strand:- start:18792 stop:19013 length:222 start_codon:yes stop_codon:yes gene_type:complete